METLNEAYGGERMVHIAIKNGQLQTQADGYQFQVSLETGMAALSTAAGEHLFDLPLDVEVKHLAGISQVPVPLHARIEGTTALLSSGATGVWSGQHFRLEFAPDWIEVRYSATVAPGQSTAVQETRYFRRGKLGMQLKYCWEGLQPAPEGGREALECYETTFPRCSAGSYFSPPPLVLFQHLPAGWVGMGLTTLPNAKQFALEHSRCLLVDTPAGHLPLCAGQTYDAPALMLIFPQDGWSGLRLFHDILVRRGLADGTPIWERGYPEWWKRPIYCTYGDQMIELQHNEYTPDDWGAPTYTEEWVRGVVQRAEERLQYREFTVLIDAFWQHPWDADPKPSSRFAHLRELIDLLHERGHRVLLWIAPMSTATTEGCGQLAVRHGLLELPCRSGTTPLDFTSPGLEGYAAEMAETLFGSAPGQLDADGVKMDGLGAIREPSQAHYQRPQVGLGVREARHFLETFVGAARRVRPDVCINYSAADPRFTPWISMNRLHDIHSSWQERDRRARISTLAAPDMIMDTDAFAMYSHWLEPSYLNMAIAGTLTIGYTDLIHDGVRLSDRTMATLGQLGRLSAQRPWGRPEFVAYGHWRLWQRERVVGEVFERQALMLFPSEEAGYVLTFNDAEVEISTYGRLVAAVSPEPPSLHIAGDRVRAQWQGGVLYKLRKEK